MPVKDREAYNAYHRVYQLRRYHERMERWIKHLGGKCTLCGSRKRLHIDHMDPDKKNKRVSRAWQGADKDVIEELKKCQLLCRKCHDFKSAYDRGQKPAIGTHGTLSSYRHCKCAKCKAAKVTYMREYYQRRKRASSSGKAATS